MAKTIRSHPTSHILVSESFFGTTIIFSGFGPKIENRREVPQNGSGTKMWDVGCDRMVFAIKSDIFLIKFNAEIIKWSLDQGQQTINPLIPLSNAWWPSATNAKGCMG